MVNKLLPHFQSEHESVQERIARGKALREKFPRIEQGKYTTATNRADPVSILELRSQRCCRLQVFGR